MCFIIVFKWLDSLFQIKEDPQPSVARAQTNLRWSQALLNKIEKIIIDRKIKNGEVWCFWDLNEWMSCLLATGYCNIARYTSANSPSVCSMDSCANMKCQLLWLNERFTLMDALQWSFASCNSPAKQKACARSSSSWKKQWKKYFNCRFF